MKKRNAVFPNVGCPVDDIDSYTDGQQCEKPADTECGPILTEKDNGKQNAEHRVHEAEYRHL